MRKPALMTLNVIFCFYMQHVKQTLLNKWWKLHEAISYRWRKDAMPVSFRSELFTSCILTWYLSMKTNSCKYEKLLNLVIHACKNITEKMNLLKTCGPQIRLCLFTFRPIASKLQSLLTVDSVVHS